MNGYFYDDEEGDLVATQMIDGDTTLPLLDVLFLDAALRPLWCLLCVRAFLRVCVRARVVR